MPDFHPPRRRSGILVGMAFAVSAAAFAPSEVAGADSAPAPCAGAHYRELDFWVGRWDVFLPNGSKAGENVIETFAGGCGLLENWTGRGGVTGKSVNGYDATDGKWHQTWVDSSGSRLVLAGGLSGQAIVLTSEGGSATLPRSSRIDRVTFTPGAHGTVRQLWEYSEDAGKTWNLAFDGKYVRQK